MRELICYTVGNVASSRRTTVGTDDDALVELNCHDRGPEIDLSALEPVHVDAIHAAAVVVVCYEEV